MPHSTHAADRMGHATLEPAGPLTAGSLQSLTLTYTAGFYGIDDTGSIEVVTRHVSDMASPQFDDPGAPGFVTVEASNGAVLDVLHHDKLNLRPWDRTLLIRVVRGFLREGDRIVVRYGDPRWGSPGIRLQTFAEESFEFRVLVDAFATSDYVELPESPAVAIVPGPPVVWRVVLPTMRRVGETFRLGLRGEDRWGNPSDLCDAEAGLRSSVPVDGLPESVRLGPGSFATVLDGLSVAEPADLRIELIGPDGGTLARSNPLRIVEGASLVPYWADFHGQSEETVGTNSARDYFLFARDRAFLDLCAHQGNDFQITDEFWRRLNVLTGELNEDGRFVVFPGYEWSGNTALGGDRNVLYVAEGHAIHRSSRVLVDDTSHPESDAPTLEELFRHLRGEDCVVVPHVGGRYADIRRAHDARLERSVEVHSAWGTFEWLLSDALELGRRVGITANSDGHKGRPGASHPGASTFGAYGGLTCVLAKELTRDSVVRALRARHHYATTGCRLILDVDARFDGPAELLGEEEDAAGRPVTEAIMGDVVRCHDPEVTLRMEVVASAPIERVEIRNGMKTLETCRPYGEADLGRRIRVVWEGSEYRGRGRQTVWDGRARLVGNRFERVRPINFHNPERRLELADDDHLEWSALTTGGFGGFDAWLADPMSGTLAFQTPLLEVAVRIDRIGLADHAWDAGGLGRRLRIFRLPDENGHESFTVERRVRLRPGQDNPFYARVTTEDGHLAWSSPIYVVRP